MSFTEKKLSSKALQFLHFCTKMYSFRHRYLYLNDTNFDTDFH